MSKGAKLRRAAMAQDVRTRVYYGRYVGNLANPYPQDDIRHRLFDQEMARVHYLDEETKLMFEVYGVCECSLPRRHYEDPGPVLDLDELVQAFLVQRENERQRHESMC